MGTDHLAERRGVKGMRGDNLIMNLKGSKFGPLYFYASSSA